MVKVSVELSLDEIRPVVVPQVQKAIADSKITEPNAVLGEFSIADQHYPNPKVVLDANQLTMTCESEPGQPLKLLIQLPVLMEAQKKEVEACRTSQQRV